MNKEIVISVKTIAITLLSLLAIYVVYRLGSVFGMLFVAWLLAIALEPVVKLFMQIIFLNRPLPRSVAVLLTYLIFVALLVLVFTLGLPPILTQATKLITSVNDFLKRVVFIGNVEISLAEFVPNLGDLSRYAVSFTYEILSNLMTIITILFLSLYTSLDWENLKNKFVGLFSGRLRKKVEETVDDIEVDIAHWVKGQVILMISVGVLSFVGLILLGLDYPLALALISGVLEIVPLFGPLVASVLATLVGFTMSPIKGITAFGVFAIVQQLENNFLVPKVMHRISGFSPLAILIAVIVGGNFFGILGAVLAVPIIMVSWIIFRKVKEYFAGS